MLDVAYEAVEDMPAGRLAKIDEDRGQIRVRLDKNRPLADVIRQLNVETEHLLRSGHWFQWWEDEVISPATVDCPLRMQFVFRDWVTDGVAVGEDRGNLTVYIDPGFRVAEFAAAMDKAAHNIIAGGQWFQLYAGEIIDHSPEPMSQV